MNNFTVKFELIDSDAVKEDWETEKSLKELNKHIAQLLVMMPWYTIIEDSKAININRSHIKYFTITNK
jgi:hypothetical protein